MIVDPGTGGVYSLCIRDRNNSQKPDSETRGYNEGKKYPEKEQPGGVFQKWQIPQESNNFSTNSGNFPEH